MKIIILLILIFSSIVTAKENYYVDYLHSFGLKASNISGYGAFYGYRVIESLKLQVTGIYYMYESEDYEWKKDLKGYTIGIEIQQDLHQKYLFRIYLMEGGYYYFDDDYEDNFDESFEHTVKDSWNCGLGIGVEFFFHRLTVAGEVGVKYFYDYGDVKRDSNGWRMFIEKNTKIGAGLTIGFIM